MIRCCSTEIWRTRQPVSSDDKVLLRTADDDDGLVLLDGPLDLGVGSEVVWQATHRLRGQHAARTAIFHGDEAVAVGVAATTVQTTNDGGDYRQPATQDVLRPATEGSRLAITTTQPPSVKLPTKRTWIHPLVLLGVLNCVAVAHVVVTDYHAAEQRCTKSCAMYGICQAFAHYGRQQGDSLPSLFYSCGAADDADCARSQLCLKQGECSAVDGRCSVTKDDD